MVSEAVQLESGWKRKLVNEFSQPYMLDLKNFLRKEITEKKTIYPKGKEIFNAFNSTPFDKVRVVIIGQDPYHGVGQAHGLCFSVRKGIPLPPSLLNIFKELKNDLDIPISKHGDLSHWSEQGVLLLNSVLTVEDGQAASHQGKGWEKFTDKAIQTLGQRKDPILFLLWGSFAQSKSVFIQSPPHIIFKAPHPSPLSAHRGFLGCKHFSKVNETLKQLGKDPIDWALPQ